MPIRRILLILAMLVGLAGQVACNSATSEHSEAGHEQGAPTTLVGYLIGTAPPGLTEVLAELNRKLRKDVGATIDLRYIQWSELTARYPQVLSSGENVDFIFAGNWAYFAQEAAKGSFMELTEEMIKRNMPMHYAATNPDAWLQSRVNGKIFILPSASPDAKVPVTLIRGDLRKKYGLPEIHRMSELEPYLAAVKANEPDMTPIRVDKQYDFPQTLSYLQWELGPGTVDVILTTNGFTGVYTDWDDPEGKLLSPFDEPYRTNFLRAAETVRRWVNLGYINRASFANKVRSKESFEAGQSAVAYGNTIDIKSTFAIAEQRGWEVEIIPNLSPNGTYMMDPYINNGVAIPADSRHAEIALRALDYMMEDPSYVQLVYYGIEGKDYILKDEKVVLTADQNVDNNNYLPDAAGFWFINRNKLLPIAGLDLAYSKHREEAKNMLVPYVYSSFIFNPVPVQAELEKVNQAGIQYWNPIVSGMVDDVESAFLRAEKEIKNAGFERIMEEAQKQSRGFREQARTGHAR